MTIEKTKNGTAYNLALVGRLDTTTAPQLEEEIKPCFEDATEIVLDFAKLDYISSAGLRVLLASQKAMAKRGEVILRNVGETIREILEVTGFIDIFTVD